MYDHWSMVVADRIVFECFQLIFIKLSLCCHNMCEVHILHKSILSRKMTDAIRPHRLTAANLSKGVEFREFRATSL